MSFQLDGLEQALAERRPIGWCPIHVSINGLAKAIYGSKKPGSPIGEGHGGLSKPSKSPKSNRSTGSTIAGCWNSLARSLQPKLKTATMLCSNIHP